MSSSYRSIPGLLLAALAGAAGGHFVPDFQDEVRTRNLVIVDENGKEVGIFGGDELGSFLRLGADGYRDQSIMIYASNLKDMGGGASISVASRDDQSGEIYTSSVLPAGVSLAGRWGDGDHSHFHMGLMGMGADSGPYCSFQSSSTPGGVTWSFPFELPDTKQDSGKSEK